MEKERNEIQNIIEFAEIHIQSNSSPAIYGQRGRPIPMANEERYCPGKPSCLD